ncbi:MAG: TIGR02757 family protein [Bacteroides sp.]
MTIDIKERLDELAQRYNTSSFIEHDPVQFPHRYVVLQDIEISALLTAIISWGNRASILKSAEKMLALMGNSPYDYVMSEGYCRLRDGNIHRTFFETDLLYMCVGLRAIYNQYNSLEDVFVDKPNVWDGLGTLRALFSKANGGQSSKHLSNPASGSACKRLNMALRWLVRKDGIVDLGVWKRMSPADLYIPLDVHVARISREFSILHRKTNDRKAVEELTSFLRKLNSEDPTIYDFALFGLGEETVNK